MPFSLLGYLETILRRARRRRELRRHGGVSGALDPILPRYRHRQFHATHVAAPPEVVWEALHAVEGRELALTGLLTRVRGLGAPDAGMPFLESMGRRFRLLVEIHRRPWWPAPPDSRGDAMAASGLPWRLASRCPSSTAPDTS